MGLPVKVVVLNNGTLGFVEMEMKASGFLDTGCALKNPDFAAMATAAEAYHFGVVLLKAVLDGRGREVIDLAKVNLNR